MLPMRLLIGARILSQACGIDKCPVEIRIEGDSFVVATTHNFNASQRIVPDLQRLGLHFVKAFISSNFHEQCMLCLCFGLSASLEETQELLRLCGLAELYPKVRRDAIIIYGLLHGMDLFAVNDRLFSEDEETLF